MRDERELGRLAAGGDAAALGELLAAHQDAAFAMALALTGNAEDAQDACQEAFVAAVRGAARFRPEGSFRAWLLLLVRTAARDLRRSAHARRQREGNYAMNATASAATTAVPRLDERSAASAVQGALMALEERYRLPVMLHYCQGLSHSEVAEVLELPAGTVATNVSRGVERLREALSRGGFPAAVAVAGLLGQLPQPTAPAALGAAVAEIGKGMMTKGASGSLSATGAIVKGGLLVKIGLGVAAAGLLAGGVAFFAGPSTLNPPPGFAEATPGRPSTGLASPPAAAEKVPGKDFPYGEGVVYRRQIAAIGSLANGGYQDGPGPQMELTGDCGRALAPNGDWYFLDQEMNNAVVRYDARKKRAYTIAWAGPIGKQGGPAECARFAGGGYGAGMGLGVDPGGKFLVIQDTNNSSYMWKLDLETMTVEPTSGAEAVKGSAVRGGAPDGSTYFAKADGKLKKVSPDGKTVQDLGATLESPLQMSSFFGGLLVNEKAGRLYAGSRDAYSPWGVVWYWDMKTGKATGLCGPKTIGGESGKRVAQDGGEVDKNFHCASGPFDKVSFWCTGGPSFGPDRGERYLYLPGGDESTCSRLDLEKKYVTKMVKADPKGDRSLWTFGEGKQGKDYRFADPYCWASSPCWGRDGEFYMVWALCSAIDLYTPVQK